MSHIEVYEMMKRIDQRKKLFENVDWLSLETKLIRTTTYSNSIILYSKDNSKKSLDYLIRTTSGLTNELFIQGVPHKGTLAFGIMTLDMENSIFFGQPLIDAYLLQEEIYFYGVLVHATAEQQLLDKKLDDIPFIKNYLCNLKVGSAKHLTIYPMHSTSIGDPKYNLKYEELRDSINKLRWKTSGNLRKYIDNTELYIGTVSKANKI